MLTNMKQEAQLTQRDYATLRVIEYFAQSLKIIRNYTFEWACVSHYYCSIEIMSVF